MKQQKPWSREEIETLRALVRAGKTAKQISQTLERTDRAVQNKAFKLGLQLTRFQKRRVDVRSPANVRCPFFISLRRGREIQCEGVGQAARVALLFESEANWKQTVRKHCDRAWESCPVAKMLNEKYK